MSCAYAAQPERSSRDSVQSQSRRLVPAFVFGVKHAPTFPPRADSHRILLGTAHAQLKNPLAHGTALPPLLGIGKIVARTDIMPREAEPQAPKSPRISRSSQQTTAVLPFQVPVTRSASRSSMRSVQLIIGGAWRETD